MDVEYTSRDTIVDRSKGLPEDNLMWAVVFAMFVMPSTSALHDLSKTHSQNTTTEQNIGA